ncbi:hypothetical protein K503DRAFT_855706 [Rhizopogon vinicolor AM-OR11-026]|uniref:Cyanovirin-N domain-containing protein n=1 Tax=Rhizopogon vinicolor AM-OR11-026 TaxID=1314800 RepID=A0A1B7N502_9AGAM|nr:hypothetical protein K503DRAFT_855706 [Rhizopogon vinicolor AM-OR11-026]
MFPRLSTAIFCALLILTHCIPIAVSDCPAPPPTSEAHLCSFNVNRGLIYLGRTPFKVLQTNVGDLNLLTVNTLRSSRRLHYYCQSNHLQLDSTLNYYRSAVCTLQLIENTHIACALRNFVSRDILIARSSQLRIPVMRASCLVLARFYKDLQQGEKALWTRTNNY